MDAPRHILRHLLLGITLCCATGWNAQAQTPALNAPVPTDLKSAAPFVTLDGRSFEACTVTRITPEGIVVMTSSGTSKIPYDQLPESMRVAYEALKPATPPSREEPATSPEDIARKQQEEMDRLAQEKAADLARKCSEALAAISSESDPERLLEKIALAAASPEEFATTPEFKKMLSAAAANAARAAKDKHSMESANKALLTAYALRPDNPDIKEVFAENLKHIGVEILAHDFSTASEYLAFTREISQKLFLEEFTLQTASNWAVDIAFNDLKAMRFKNTYQAFQFAASVWPDNPRLNDYRITAGGLLAGMAVLLFIVVGSLCLNFYTARKTG